MLLVFAIAAMGSVVLFLLCVLVSLSRMQLYTFVEATSTVEETTWQFAESTNTSTCK